MRPKIKNYHKGYASNDGNGMVGGKWWGCERLAYKTVYITDHIDIPVHDDFGARWDKVVDWFDGKDELVIEAYIEIGEDKSTNYSAYDLDEVFYPDEFDDLVGLCPYLSDPEREDAITKFRSFVDELDAGDFELYELDEED